MSWYYYPRSAPRKAKGGMRLRSGKGAAQSWWGAKWVEALESFGWHTRLTRGRSYARRGQVVSVEIQPGEALAQVQGSRAKPYEVRIGLRRIPHKDWMRVSEKLAQKAVFTAKLLAGEMPDGLDEAFRRAGFPLFPKSIKDLETECSCPDWENPCKHIAAVYYILAQEMDRDPFLLLRIRGMEKKDFLEKVRLARREGPTVPKKPDDWRPEGGRPGKRPFQGPSSTAAAGKAGAPGPVKGPEISKDYRDFYKLAKDLPADWGPRPERAAQAPPPGSLVKEMGVPPFWRGETSFEDALILVLKSVRGQTASQAALPAPAGPTTHPRATHRRSRQGWATQGKIIMP